MGFKVAVVGATGNVGREMMNILSEREFPADEVVALASRKSLGQEVAYGDKTLKTKALDHYDFSDTDICLMSAGNSRSERMFIISRPTLPVAPTTATLKPMISILLLKLVAWIPGEMPPRGL